MADHAGEHESVAESVMDKITETFKGHDSSSDSDNEKDHKSPAAAVKAKIYRLFGREKPVHKVLGGGKRTDGVSISLSASAFYPYLYVPEMYNQAVDP